jgi:hypothetical protein
MKQVTFVVATIYLLFVTVHNISMIVLFFPVFVLPLISSTSNFALIIVILDIFIHHTIYTPAPHVLISTYHSIILTSITTNQPHSLSRTRRLW